MALLKEIKSSNGITGTYHRIGNITKNYNKLSVEVESYADATYRQQEKECLDLAGQMGGLISKLSVLTGSVCTDETKKEIDKVNAKIEKYQNLCKMGQFYIFKTTVLLDWDEADSISFETVYQKLASGDSIFSEAKPAE